MIKQYIAGCAIGIALLFGLAALHGCGANPAAAAHPGKGAAAAARLPQINIGETIAGVTRQPLLQLEVYQMALPVGAVSRSDEFWKHVEEQRLDPATYDLLLKNGVRVGVAPNDDWDYFREILFRNHAQTATGVATASGGGTVELSMKKSVPEQNIFYLDDVGELHGRTYEHCEDLLGISFYPEPRHPGEVLLTVTPTIRSLRTYYQYSVQENETEIKEVRPEFLYQLNLRIVIPADSFLVISPSRESKWPTTLGNTFFHVDGKAEQLEQVLVLAPSVTSRIGPTAAAR
jgi:hypothetical protein